MGTMNEKTAILIIEDEPELLDILREILEPEVDQVILASNGLDALEKMEKHSNIRAIISDINMPKMSGLDLLKQIRSDFNPIPFVVLTAYGNPVSMRQAIQLQATDFIDKPFKTEELVEVAKRALEYGKELAKIEQEIEEMFKDSKQENLVLLKRLKRTTLAMRAENSIYLSKIK